MQRHVVAGVAGVDGLDDVDLAVGGPGGDVAKPEGGPGRAAEGRVVDVEEEEARCVGLLGREAHGAAAFGGVAAGVVHAEDGGAGGGERIRQGGVRG